MLWRGVPIRLSRRDGEEIYTPEDGWRDQHMWSLMRQVAARIIPLCDAKPMLALLDWGAKDNTNNWAEIHEAETFM